ncbi:hypothetical protein [uncultured Adlercreutzia sp.]|uniref:hypothetical protein n=1 Tax=uncultured Adlercreutzia sp. TaxID=875803 RepID=UPI0026744D80|nr:hypothetical protein [uncultured Adlercreutzia sp.]
MANFKVIFRSDNQDAATAPGWEPGCPLLINAVQVSRNTDTSQCFLQLKLSNLSSEIVSSYELQVDVAYADGTTETVDLKPLDADIQPGQTCRPDPVLLSGSDILGATARVIAVSQPNGSWHTTSAAKSIPVGEPLELEQFAAIERKRLLVDLGKDPDDYSRRIVEGEDWWVCPCGTPNVGRSTCCACGMNREALKNLEDETYLHAKAEERKVAEKAREGKRKRLAIAVIAIALVALSACLLNQLVIQPELQRQADEQNRQAAAEQQAEAQRQAEERRQTFINEERSCSALVSMTRTRTAVNQLESTTVYTLDQKGNIVAASRVFEETGATQIVNISVDDLGFPRAVTDESGATISEFSIDKTSSVGLPLQVTQTTADGTTVSYTFAYDQANNLSFFEQSIGDQFFDITKADGDWQRSCSLEAASTPALVLNEGYYRDFSGRTTVDKEMGDNDRLLMYRAAGSKFEYAYESISNASPWAAIVAQMPVEDAPLPYNIWLGIE